MSGAAPLLLLAVGCARDGEPWAPPWVLQPGATTVTSAAVDPDGNTVFGGRYEQTFTLGDLSLPPGGSSNGFVASVDGAGGARWATAIPADTTATTAVSMAVEHDGGGVWAGSVWGALELDGVGVTAHGGSSDALVVGFDERGRTTFVDAFGAGGQDDAVAVALGRSGAAVAGWRQGEGAGVESFDPWFAALDEDGGLRWEVRLSGPAHSADAVTVDDRGVVTVSGGFEGRLDFDDATSVVRTVGVEEYLARYSPHGEVLAATGVPAVDQLVAGDDGAVFASHPGGGLSRYAADGTLAWTVAPTVGPGGNGYLGVDPFTRLCRDTGGALYVGGAYTGSLDFGDGVHDVGSGFGLYVASYTPGGALRWSRTMDVVEVEGGYGLAPRLTALAAGAPDVVVAGGSFWGLLETDAGEITSGESEGTFVATVSPP